MLIRPGLAQYFGGARFVRAIRIAIDEKQADRLASLFQQCRRRGADRVGINRYPDLTARKGRSATSRRLCRSITGVNCPHNPRVWPVTAPHFNTSRNPAVVMMPAFAPLRSSRAFVATVVPWMIVDTASSSSVAALMPLRNPADWSPRVEGHLGDTHLAGIFIKGENVGEGTANIDTDHDGFAHES